jgi:hypothetical protein
MGPKLENRISMGYMKAARSLLYVGKMFFFLDWHLSFGLKIYEWFG